jgi:phosphatidylserine/phosphatidylglycerophosphate/cardiolipin synthase-like enzyme
MAFERPVLAVSAGADAAAAVRMARTLAPEPTAVGLLLLPPILTPSWSVWDLFTSSNAPSPGGEQPQRPDLQALLTGWTQDVTTEVAQLGTPAELMSFASARDADLLVIAPSTRADAERLAPATLASADAGRPALWLPTADRRQREGPIRHVLCPFEVDVRTLADAAVTLRRPLAGVERITLLALRQPDPPVGAHPSELLELAGVRTAVQVEQAAFGLTQLAEGMAGYVRDQSVDLVVVAVGSFSGPSRLFVRFASGKVLEQLPAPLLIMPDRRSARALGQPELDSSDALLPPQADRVVLRVEELGVFEQPSPVPDTRVALFAHGRRVAEARVSAGELTLDPAWLHGRAAAGLTRVGLAGPDPSGVLLASVIAQAGVARTGDAPVTLLDAAIAPAVMCRLAELLSSGAAAAGWIIAVRTRPEQSFRALRRALVAAGIEPPLVLDAGAVLDDGQPEDLVSGLEPLRLLRAARRLRTRGVHVQLVVHTGRRRFHSEGLLTLAAEELEHLDAPALSTRTRAAYRPPAWRGAARDTLERELDELSASRARRGNRVAVELDNRTARRTLLRLIDGARERIHLQSYIVDDDARTRELADALARACGRGVRVRVLVDSLLSMHGSFTTENPVLGHLEQTSGAEVRVVRPVGGLPGLKDLKHRDHKKLMTVDSATAMVTGRNLGAVYLTGFDEARVGPETQARDVPWLDAGVLLEGPVVADADRAFHGPWVEAGGAGFPVRAPAPIPGGATARLVVHHGLRDTTTLDAYLALFRAARSHLYVVNTFPLQREVVHALRQALARGVAVRLLFGNVRPVFGRRRRAFPGSSIRELATALVHARMDELVRAGAEAYELVIPRQPGWHPRVSQLRPHVHAKIVTMDGRVASVGSANLDITAGYWESEAQVLLHDTDGTAALEARLDALLAQSERVDPGDPAWRRRAERRAWLNRWWPSVIG